MEIKEKKRRCYDISNLPMDIARVVCTPLLLLYRMRRITPEGDPYKDRIRGGAVLAANHRTFSDPFRGQYYPNIKAKQRIIRKEWYMPVFLHT